MSNIIRNPLAIIAFIAAVAFVVFPFVVAMGYGVGMLLVLAGVVSIVCYLVYRVARALFKLMQDYAKDKYIHAENMSKQGIIVRGRGFPQYELKQAQIEAPAQAAPVAQALPDPRREKALTLLNATIESDKYGPKSQRLMTQKDAGAVGIIADDWSAAVAYLFLFGVATGNTGTIIKDSRNVARLIADVARDKQDAGASGVMSLPEVEK